MKIPERAAQIWSVLAWSATHRQTITYPQLTQVTGAFTGGLGALLEPIQSYCILKGLPPLTVLVVQKESGLPGEGFSAVNAAEVPTAQAKVFTFNWLEHGNPGAEQFERAVKERPSNGSRGT